MEKYYVYFDGECVAIYASLRNAVRLAKRGQIRHLTVMVTEGLGGKVVWMWAR